MRSQMGSSLSSVPVLLSSSTPPCTLCPSRTLPPRLGSWPRSHITRSVYPINVHPFFFHVSSCLLGPCDLSVIEDPFTFVVPALSNANRLLRFKGLWLPRRCGYLDEQFWCHRKLHRVCNCSEQPWWAAESATSEWLKCKDHPWSGLLLATLHRCSCYTTWWKSYHIHYLQAHRSCR